MNIEKIRVHLILHITHQALCKLFVFRQKPITRMNLYREKKTLFGLFHKINYV